MTRSNETCRNMPAELRNLLARPGLLRACAPHDAFTALVLQRAGVELLFLGGFGTSASMLGVQDIGLITLTEMTDAIRRIAGRVSVPLIADGDTGHGGLPNVARTVRDFEAAGAAGILIEDQVFPKRCGHFAGKQVIATNDMVKKLEVALESRRNPEFVVIARTDARAVEGLDAAIDRAKRYARLGVDLCFVEAPESRDELVRIAREIPLPQLANMLPGGITPVLSCQELESIGFKIAVDPISSLTVTELAVRQMVQQWLREGKIEIPSGSLSFTELKEFLGVS